MARTGTPTIGAWCLLLLIVLSHGIGYVQGRNLKGKHDSKPNVESALSKTVEVAARGGAVAMQQEGGASGYPTGPVTDFRPTSPGRSPGAGHAIGVAARDGAVAMQQEGVGNAGQVDDFRPTTPGRSPGAGHSIHN